VEGSGTGELDRGDSGMESRQMASGGEVKKSCGASEEGGGLGLNLNQPRRAPYTPTAHDRQTEPGLSVRRIGSWQAMSPSNEATLTKPAGPSQALGQASSAWWARPHSVVARLFYYFYLFSVFLANQI
jgi:hypothetical protein